MSVVYDSLWRWRDQFNAPPAATDEDRAASIGESAKFWLRKKMTIFQKLPIQAFRTCLDVILN